MQPKKRKIEIRELPKKVPEYKNSKISKDIMTENWLTDWILQSLVNNTIKPYDLLPVKQKLAYYLGVSMGTIQSAIRYMEDKGIVESKQKIGTYIKPQCTDDISNKKLTGKRDIAIRQIKKYIVENQLKIGEKLPSIRNLAKMFSFSTNTIRLSLEHLVNTKILQYVSINNECYLTVHEIPKIQDETKFEMKTLTSKIESDFLNYIKSEFNVGDKFLTHHQLAKKFNVSVKTTHDAVKSLISKGYLVSRRGQYGTIVVKTSEKSTFQPKPETTIFAKASDAAIYRYVKIENSLKQMISDNFDLGAKLPSMENLAKRMDVSTNTIKKALHNLAKQGYIGFSRGRYGGSFVINIPESQEQTAFRWLAVNQNYVEINR